jgi:UDPglucose 6-dehydrogenase
MNITIVGTGYVGLVAGACFANMGNRVVCVDIDEEKIARLSAGDIPIYEPGLSDIVKRTTKENLLSFTTDISEGLKKAEACFVAVGTPTAKDGSADLRYVHAVAKSIGQLIKKYIVVVDKSTVPVGTQKEVKRIISAELKKRGKRILFDVVSNPEFMKEGAAIEDFMKPDRVVFGTESERAEKTMRKIYEPFVKRSAGGVIAMDVESAEMTKYAANAMLALKISYINEIANICERVGANANMVRKGIGSDSRIGYQFIYPGLGYGGSCFPKDVRALIKTAENVDCSAKLVTAIDKVNEAQKLSLASKIEAKFGGKLNGKTFAVWGLAFKPETDDMREASSVPTIKKLVSKGAKVVCYDPVATNNAKENYLNGVKNVSYASDKYECARAADALLLITDWREFKMPDFALLKKLMNRPLIFDGRNQYDAAELKGMKFEYHQIGVGSKDFGAKDGSKGSSKRKGKD